MADEIETTARRDEQPAAVSTEFIDESEDPLQLLTLDSEYKFDVPSLIETNRRLSTQNEKLEKKLKSALLKKSQQDELKPYQAELIKMQQCLEKRGQKMIILFEGRGAAGKGGTIGRMTQYMNARHYRIVAMGKPTYEQRTQWYYQRFIKEFPRAGEIVLFDRSWYNRALIEPIFGFCTNREYQDFIDGVAGFESDLVRQNTILIKLYFSVSEEEQRRRFKQRKKNPLQSWKLKEVDLDAEERREEFTDAKYEMLRCTHTPLNPWTIIRSDEKHQARLNAMKVILNSVKYSMLNPELDITPDPEVVVSGAYELERMKAQRLREGRL